MNKKRFVFYAKIIVCMLSMLFFVISWFFFNINFIEKIHQEYHQSQSKQFGIRSVCLFVWILYVQVNNFSVMLGQVFMAWSSTMQRIKCLAQGHNAVLSVSEHAFYSVICRDDARWVHCPSNRDVNWMSPVKEKSPPVQVKEPYGNLEMVTIRLSFCNPECQSTYTCQ